MTSPIARVRSALTSSGDVATLVRQMGAGAAGPLLSFVILFALPLTGAVMLSVEQFAMWSLLSTVSTIALSIDFGGVALTMARIQLEPRGPLLRRAIGLSMIGSALIGLVECGSGLFVRRGRVRDRRRNDRCRAALCDSGPRAGRAQRPSVRTADMDGRRAVHRDGGHRFCDATFHAHGLGAPARLGVVVRRSSAGCGARMQSRGAVPDASRRCCVDSAGTWHPRDLRVVSHPGLSDVWPAAAG